MITALTLKYRPQKISELDLKSARSALLKIFESGKIPSAFLFSGPKGIGKTSAARIVAKAVNCVGKVQSFEPCNECPACLSITNGTNLDIMEIDAASNRGIDDIRELKDKISLSPSSAKYKVYIIDEVHMLTNEAFNALLKTLEEPPSHAIFILCTTAPEKLPQTIISRCTRINFKKASPQEIIEKLKKICVKEGFQFSQNDLGKIAQAAGGSFRDAIKILEQAAVSSVDEVIGTLGEFRPQDLLSFVCLGKTREAILWLNKAVEQGANLRILTEEILRILREGLLVKYGIEFEDFLGFEGIEGLSVEEIKTLIGLFSKAALELKVAVVPQLPLEMTVIEWGMNNEQRTMGERINGDNREEKIEEKTGEKEKSPGVHGSKSMIQVSEILSKWPEVLEKVKPLNHSVQAFLKATRPVSFEDGFLTLEVFYKFHKDQLEQEKCRRMVEQVCAEVFLAPIKLKFVLGEKPKIAKVPEKIKEPKVPNVDFSGEEDLVKIAEEIFNGGVVH